MGGCAVALVSFADTSVLSRVYSARTRTYVDPTGDGGAGRGQTWQPDFFRAFRSTAVRHVPPWPRPQAPKTQLTGVVGALAVALLLMVAPDLLQDFPAGALAAVVIAAAIGLIEVTDLQRSVSLVRRCNCLAIDRLYGRRGRVARF